MVPLLMAGALAAADGPRLFLSKAFPGSVPAYSEIRLDRAGHAEYREAPDEDLPLTFRLPDTATQEIFGLAEKLDYFQRPLESRAKVAFTGTKTFRYEDGQRKTEVKFNYSEDSDARALLDWFERMAETEGRRIDLERAAKYDHLGLVRALLLFQSAMENGRVVAPEQFLPILDRIAKNQTYMHTAQERAAELADTIRKPKTPPAP